MQHPTETSVHVLGSDPPQVVAAALLPARRRSAAQAAASRLNGAKSRGPRTLLGKARSRANAVRHGLLARKVSPAAGPLNEHREYHHLLRGLVEEYEPQAASEWAWVELLASDFVQLGRVRQLQEAAMATPEPPGVYWTNAYAADAEDQLAVAERVLTRFSRGRPRACWGEAMEWFVKQVLGHAAGLREDAQRLAEMIDRKGDEIVQDGRGETPEDGKCIENEEGGEDDEEGGDADGESEGGEDDDGPDEALVRSAELAKRVDPATLVGDGEPHVSAVLNGEVDVAGVERDRWVLLLRSVRDELAGRVRAAGERQAALDDRYEPQRHQLLELVPTLVLLQRYETGIRRNIERTERRLLGTVV